VKDKQDFIYGRNPVGEALLNERPIEKLYIEHCAAQYEDVFHQVIDKFSANRKKVIKNV